jgi:DNA-binding FadR family transcriptional regulator
MYMPAAASSAPGRTPPQQARRGGHRPAGPAAQDAMPALRARYPERRLPAQVIQLLGRRIVAGAYPEGAALPNEGLLCEELGVSRTALREGVKVLVAKGLLVARPRVGTRVQPRAAWHSLDADVLAWRSELPPDDAFIEQLTEMREIIEPAAAALAARNRSDADVAVLQAALLRMRRARTQPAWVAADFDFHRALLHATGNALLAPLAALVGSALQSLLALGAARARETTRNFKVALPEHERVFDAVCRRDGTAAHQAMSLLLSDARRRLLPGPGDVPVQQRRAVRASRASTRRR